MAEVATQLQTAHLFMAHRHGINHVPRSIATPVVDETDIAIRARKPLSSQICKKRSERRERLRQNLLLVVTRYNDGEARHVPLPKRLTPVMHVPQFQLLATPRKTQRDAI